MKRENEIESTVNDLDTARLTTRSIHQDWKLKKGTLPPLVQVLELSWRPPCQLQSMPILVPQVQQGVAPEKIC